MDVSYKTILKIFFNIQICKNKICTCLFLMLFYFLFIFSMGGIFYIFKLKIRRKFKCEKNTFYIESNENISK